MLSSDVVAFFIEKVPDEIRIIRDDIAKEEINGTGQIWEHNRQLSGHIKELKNRCEQAGHSLIIVLAGLTGTRRRMMRNHRDERRTCIMCGTEEVGKVATGFMTRLLLGRSKWKFETLNGHISRTFNDPGWYFETVSIIRNFSFSTDVVLHHAFPHRIPPSF